MKNLLVISDKIVLDIQANGIKSVKMTKLNHYYS